MKRKTARPLIALAFVSLVAAASHLAAGEQPLFVPPLHPAGADLVTQQLAHGVYALVSTKPPVDNAGFVVGENGVLVIDAHINGEMASRIQAAVRQVTRKPILYLVNTNHHGDHTFGNYAFPDSTQIIAHRRTAELMRDFEDEKKLILATVDNDASVLAGVRLRLPDIVFDDFLSVDLGGIGVEIHHFGHGNTPGDTVVYVPGAKAAWTGNFILGEGTVPFLLAERAGDYLESIARMARTLEVHTIIPGHGLPATDAVLPRYTGYLTQLLQTVRGGVGAGWTLEETLANLPLPQAYDLDAETPPGFVQMVAGIHRHNVARTYGELKNGAVN